MDGRPRTDATQDRETGESHAPSWHDPALVYGPASATRRVLGIGAIGLTVALLLAAGLVGAGLKQQAACQVAPRPLTLEQETTATMHVRAGVPCSIVARIDAPVAELTVTRLPANGTLVASGRTGLVYRPEPSFRGEDFFAFAMHAGRPGHDDTSVVRVHVAVR
jgi:hypothetical protein